MGPNSQNQINETSDEISPQKFCCESCPSNGVLGGGTDKQSIRLSFQGRPGRVALQLAMRKNAIMRHVSRSATYQSLHYHFQGIYLVTIYIFYALQCLHVVKSHAIVFIADLT